MKKTWAFKWIWRLARNYISPVGFSSQPSLYYSHLFLTPNYITPPMTKGSQSSSTPVCVCVVSVRISSMTHQCLTIIIIDLFLQLRNLTPKLSHIFLTRLMKYLITFSLLSFSSTVMQSISRHEPCFYLAL